MRLEDRRLYLCVSALILVLSGPSTALETSEWDRVETAVSRAQVARDGVHLKDAPSVDSFNVLERDQGDEPRVLKRGEAVDVLWRSPKKELISGVTDYWYGAQVRDYGGFWIFGGDLEKERTYTPPWLQIYSPSGALDQHEIDSLFPRSALSLRPQLHVYHNATLKEFSLLDVGFGSGSTLRLLGRAPRGYKSGEMLLEIFRFRDTAGKDGYLRAEDIVTQDLEFHSPGGEFRFVAGVMGCTPIYPGGLKDLYFVWLQLPGGRYLSIGTIDRRPSSDIFQYAPGERFLFSSLKDVNGGFAAAVFDRDGRMIMASKERLTSPTWATESFAFLRGARERDRVYRVDLTNGTVAEFFRLEGEGQQRAPDESDYPAWEAVKYDPTSKTLTAAFSRETGVNVDPPDYPVAMVRLDLTGKVLKKWTDKRRF